MTNLHPRHAVRIYQTPAQSSQPSRTSMSTMSAKLSHAATQRPHSSLRRPAQCARTNQRPPLRATCSVEHLPEDVRSATRCACVATHCRYRPHTAPPRGCRAEAEARCGGEGCITSGMPRGGAGHTVPPPPRIPHTPGLKINRACSWLSAFLEMHLFQMLNLKF